LAATPLQEEGLRRGEIFWLRLTTASAQCLCLSERFFIIIVIIIIIIGRYIPEIYKKKWEKEKQTNRYDTQSAQANGGKQS